MGKKINFPLNNKFYFDQAVEDLMNQDFERAIENFEKLYVNDKNIEVNRLYSVTLFTSERVEEALEIANDQKEAYTTNEEMCIFYTMLLIKNHLFLEAEVLIQKYLSNPVSPYYTEWQNAVNELEKERNIVHLKKEQEILECVKKLQVIDTYSPIKQTEIITKAHIVDLQDLQKVAERLFINPQIPSTTQKALLELLIKKEDSKIYDFMWIDGLRKLAPKELSVFEEVDAMKQIALTLESKLEKNPSFIESIWSEIINDLLILYPFSDKIIKNTDFWVELYLQSFDFEENDDQILTELSPEEEEMKKWHDYLSKIAQRKLAEI